MSLYQKYRPKTLDTFFGNRLTVEALSTLLADINTMPHAIIFTGPSGCGKTTLARIVKDALKCGDMDFIEMDAAGFQGGVDTVREIRRQMTHRPIDGSVRVWLLDECHMLGEGGDSAKNKAQNALLKALEEAPKHVYFLLATTDPNRVLKTIRTRCMEFRVQPLGERQMSSLLQDIMNKEGKKNSVESETLALICRESLGSPRAAINALQKVIDLDKRQQAKAVEAALAEENQVIDLCKGLINGKSWKIIKGIVKGLQEQEPESVRRAVLGYCNSVLLSNDTINATRSAVIIKEFQYATYDSGWPQLTAACFTIADLIGKEG